MFHLSRGAAAGQAQSAAGEMAGPGSLGNGSESENEQEAEEASEAEGGSGSGSGFNGPASLSDSDNELLWTSGRQQGGSSQAQPPMAEAPNGDAAVAPPANPAAAESQAESEAAGSGQLALALGGAKRKRLLSAKAAAQHEDDEQRAAAARAAAGGRAGAVPQMRWNAELDEVITSFDGTINNTSLDYIALLAALKAHPNCPPTLTTATQVSSRVVALRKTGFLPALPAKPSAGPDIRFLPEGASVESVAAHVRAHMRTFFGGDTAKHTVLSPDVSVEWASRVHGEVVEAMGVFEGHKQLSDFWKRLTKSLEKK